MLHPQFLAKYSAKPTPRHAKLEPPAPLASVFERPSPRRAIGVAIVGTMLATATPAFAHESHTVESGDSAWAIATAHGISVTQLADANGLSNPDLIIEGTTLVIPTRSSGTTSPAPSSTSSTPASASGGSADTYTVQSGDTLWEIADANGVGVGALARSNGLEGSDPVIFPGQVLTIRGDASTPAPAPPAPSTTPSSVSSSGHTVASGETVWEIASRYGVDTDTLLTANGLSSASVILPGDTLVIPGSRDNLPADLQGDPDRLALIPVFSRWANEYGVPEDLLMSLAWFESGWNNTKISSADAIGIGQILPITADFVSEYLLGGLDLDPDIPEDNIRLSARYLRYLMDHTGDVRLAIASYYQGLTATRQHGIYSSSEFYVDGILAQQWRFA